MEDYYLANIFFERRSFFLKNLCHLFVWWVARSLPRRISNIIWPLFYRFADEFLNLQSKSKNAKEQR